MSKRLYINIVLKDIDDDVFNTIQNFLIFIRNVYSRIHGKSYVSRTPWKEFIIDLSRLIKNNPKIAKIIELLIKYSNNIITYDELANKIMEILSSKEREITENISKINLEYKVSESSKGKRELETKSSTLITQKQNQQFNQQEITQTISNVNENINTNEIEFKQQEEKENINAEVQNELTNNSQFSQESESITSPIIPSSQQSQEEGIVPSLMFENYEEEDKQGKKNKVLDEWKARQLIHDVSQSYKNLSWVCQELARRLGLKSLEKKAKEFEKKAKEFENLFDLSQKRTLMDNRL